MSAAPPNPPEPETPRREFHFKSPEFERANRAADATPGNAPIDVHQLIRQAGARPPTAASTTPAPSETESQTILRSNLARAQAQGQNEVIPQLRRPSRRKRDYWLLLVGGNLFLVGTVGVLHTNVVTLVFGLSAMVFCSLALTWIMWFVMDDY